MNDSSAARPSTAAAHDARVEVRRDGHVVASAEVTTPDEPGGTADVCLPSRRDDVAPEVRGALVDEVLGDPGVRSSAAVHVVAPLGDSASLTRLQERTTNFRARAAGASTVVDADLPPGSVEPHEADESSADGR